MTLSVKYLKAANFKEPMVVLSLRQYEALMDYLEEMEDLNDLKHRMREENISQKEVDKKFRKKFKIK